MPCPWQVCKSIIFSPSGDKSLRTINVKEITKTVSSLCQEANFDLPDDVLTALKKALETEESPVGKDVLRQVLENARLALEKSLPICQDCGVTLVYLELGQEAHIEGGDLYQAIQEGVRQGYKDGYLRKSMVEKPFTERINTGDNTPAVIRTEIVPGDKLRIIVVPKGAGSENMSRLFMLAPASGRQGIVDSVVKAVEDAGSNACPPVIVGVGIGGTADKAMESARKALLRKVGEPNTDTETNHLEQDMLKEINDLGIGPQGFGGKVTALAVHIETFPAHIGSMPVAVNIQCHALRRKEAVI
jgi:fumarate hydratase subunit alpha